MMQALHQREISSVRVKEGNVSHCCQDILSTQLGCGVKSYAFICLFVDSHFQLVSAPTYFLFESQSLS